MAATYFILAQRPLYSCLQCAWWTGNDRILDRMIFSPYVPAAIMLAAGIFSQWALRRGRPGRRADGYSCVLGAAVLVCALIAFAVTPVWWYVWLPLDGLLLFGGLRVIRCVAKGAAPHSGARRG